MLRIRFSRTGKVGQPSFRIVIAEHRSPVKGRFIELIGHYHPTKSKLAVVDKARVTHWISKGAIPTDSVAVLLKKQGMSDMDKYIAPRNRKRAPKGEEEKAPATPPKAETPAAAAA
ncbi:30S ribosomal protein S16 [Candidatus Peregrinibacteria bacterium]|nr:30S ribosomal protein S16 [Candidatus Peregrinibacteria bacterium]